MEVLLDILIRASISIAVFYTLYWMLLRQSTHFTANRIFLLISLLISVILAAVPVQYQVLISAPSSPILSEYNGVFNHNVANTITDAQKSNSIGLLGVLLLIYSIGAAIVLLRLLIQCRKPILIITKSKPKIIYNCLIHENKVFNSPFSFFNRILINPEYFQQDEIYDILTHEKVHIQERHWIDLFIIELLTVFFWFNPFIWFFERAIKRNHEYLADEGVLSRGHSPVRYQALLINRLMGTQVIGLANHFGSSLGTTRFKMMTKEKTAKRKMFRMIWGVPVLAILLMAFAKPEYKMQNQKDSFKAKNSDVQKVDYFKSEGEEPILAILEKVTKLTGQVTDEKGNPLPGASVVIQGTYIGTVVDKNGNFEINYSPNGKQFALIASFVGFTTASTQIKKDKEKSNILEYELILKNAVIKLDSKSMFLNGNVPPPPPPPRVPAPEFDKNSEKIIPVFVVVEDMPHYPMGQYGLHHYVKKNISELKSKSGNKLSGKATVGFTVDTKGNVTNVHVLEKTNDVAAKAVTLIVSGMEKWKPGSQRGKAVPVDYAMELEF